MEKSREQGAWKERAQSAVNALVCYNIKYKRLGLVMNCEELRNDIDRLKGLKETLGQKLDALNETGRGVVGVRKLRGKAGSASDEMLEKYFDDFKEQNPEISAEIRLGERIEGFHAHIRSITALPDGSVLVGGYGGELKQFMLKSGECELKDRRWIGGFDNDKIINSIAALPDGSALVGGYGRELKQFTLKDGEWEPKEIEGFKKDIHSITALPDGGALVGGDSRELRSTTSCFPAVEDLKSQLDEIIKKGAE